MPEIYFFGDILAEFLKHLILEATQKYELCVSFKDYMPASYRLKYKVILQYFTLVSVLNTKQVLLKY